MFQFLIDALLRTADLALVTLGLSMLYGLAGSRTSPTCNTRWSGPTRATRLCRGRAADRLALLIASVVTGILALGLHLLVFRRLLRAGPCHYHGRLAGAVGVLLIALMPRPSQGSFPLHVQPAAIRQPIWPWAMLRVTVHADLTSSATTAVALLAAW